MASGGRSDSSYSNACDFMYDFNCSRCADQYSRYSEASNYCQQCDTFFCSSCLVQFACAHQLLGRADLDQWGHSVPVRLEEKCPKHKSNNISVYCSQHDVVCCRACVLTSHKKCVSLQNISKISKERNKSLYLKKAQNDLKDLHTKTNQFRKDGTSRLATLDKHHTQVIDDMKEFRSELNGILDDLEKDTLQQIDIMRAEFTERIKSEQQLCNKIMDESEEIRKKISRIDKNDETLAFVRFNICDQWIREQTQIMTDISARSIGVLPKFDFNAQLEKILNKMHGVGELVSESSSSAKQVPLRQNKPSSGVNQPYKARGSIRISSDKSW